jgi:hypothetical protein
MVELMNSMTMSTFNTGKRIFESHSITWVQGGRIKVENLKTAAIQFYDYSAHALKKIFEVCDRPISKDYQELRLYFTLEAMETLGSHFVEILQDETAIFLSPKKQAGPGVRTISQNDGHGCGMKMSKNCFLRPDSRYILEDDGELTFLEEISVDNLFKKYDGPVVNVYSVHLKQKK